MSPAPLSGFRQSLDSILMASTGWFLFSICDAMTKWMSASLPIAQIICVTALIGASLSGGWIAFRHGWRGFHTPKWKWYIARGVSIIGSNYFVVHSIALIPLSDFYGIVFIAPMLTTLLATLFLKEKIGLHRIAAIAAGFTGVLIIAGPSFAGHNIGYFYAMMGALFISSNAIIIRKIGPESVIARYAFFPFLFNSMGFAPFMLMNFQVPGDGLTMFLMLFMPVISVIGVLLFSSGLARARDTAVITPFHYTQMIWGALLGFLIFHDVPTLQTVTGSLIIAGAGLFILWREHIHHKQIAKLALDIPV